MTAAEWNKRAQRWMTATVALVLAVIVAAAFDLGWTCWVLVVAEVFCGWRAVQCTNRERLAWALEMMQKASAPVDQQIKKYL